MIPNDISNCRNIADDMVRCLRMFADRTAIISLELIIVTNLVLDARNGGGE